MLMATQKVSSSDAVAKLGRSGSVTFIGLFFLALALRCLGADGRPFQYDELYNVLAGRAWAAGHGVSIATGEYVRTRLFTELVGLSIQTLGWSPIAARLPAIVGGALLVALVFAWTSSVAGRLAAWIAALLLCFSADAIGLSQTARFYSLHVLAVWVFATQAYGLAERWATESVRRRFLRAFLILCSIGVAAYLQTTAAIALVAVSAACLVLSVHRLRDVSHRAAVRTAIGLVSLAFAVLLLLPAGRDFAASAFAAFRSTAQWGQADSARPTYYYSILATEYGWMLYLLPVAALFAYQARSRPALFAITAIATALLIHSFAGMKAERYISYLDPLLMIVWAIAFAELTPILIAMARVPFGGTARWRGPLGTAIVLPVMVCAAAIGVPSYRGTVSQILRLTRDQPVLVGPDAPENEDIDWHPYLPELRPLTDTSMLVTADDLRALHFIGGYDLLLNQTVMQDVTQREFGIDPRTGGHGITSVDSLAHLIACYPTGTILVSDRRWRSADVHANVADFIERATQQVALPAGLRMRAFTWRGDDRRSTPACLALSTRIGDRRHGAGRLVTLKA